MAYIQVQCGGLAVNTDSFQVINGVVTDVDATSITNSFNASFCGGQLFDSTYFTQVGKIISANGATTVANSFNANCSILCDSSKFQLDSDGALEYKQATLTITTNPTDAVVLVVDENDNTVEPNDDDTYPVQVTKSYTYTVTKNGYTTVTDTITITGDLEVDVTLEETTPIEEG